MLRTVIAAALSGLFAFGGTAAAQDWPSRPINMVVPYAAGGPVDTIGRIMAARLSELLGQQVIVENAGGAGGMTGAARVAKAAPDGYTLLLSGSAVLAINQTLYKKPLYNAVTDFEQVALFSDSARVLIVRPNFPGNTLAEFVAYAKANQAKMQYGSAGAGSGIHVCSVLLNGAMGTKITHVPYRGAGPAMQDLIARPHRLHRRADFDRAAADPGQDRQGDCHARARSRARSRKSPDRGGTRLEGARLRLLGLILLSKRDARGDRAAACQGVERRSGDAGGARAVQEYWRDHPGAGAAKPGISDQVRPRRDRPLGRADQGERGQRKLGRAASRALIRKHKTPCRRTARR